MTAARTWAILGNPENRRVALFQEALASRGQPTALELSYGDLLTGRRSLDEIPPGAIVRIESPGENFAVDKLLLAAGVEAAEEEGGPVLGSIAIELLAHDPGRILYPRQWYLGFRRTLRAIDDHLKRRPDLVAVSSPRDIIVAFDKLCCHELCRRAGVPVPRSIGSVSCFDELDAKMSDGGLPRVMLKLANSSSASGVVAIHKRRDQWEAITSAELAYHNGQPRLYNSLRIRRYTKMKEVRMLVETLAPHRVQVERWMPKASLGGRVFDLRVLTIRGEPQHMVVRMSRGPLTNLHLGNLRGDVESLLGRLAPAQLVELQQTCRRAACVIGESLHAGLDVLFTPGFRRNFLLEINAFGDLLPRVIRNGNSTYEAEVDALLEPRTAGDFVVRDQGKYPGEDSNL